MLKSKPVGVPNEEDKVRSSPSIVVTIAAADGHIEDLAFDFVRTLKLVVLPCLKSETIEVVALMIEHILSRGRGVELRTNPVRITNGVERQRWESSCTQPVWPRTLVM